MARLTIVAATLSLAFQLAAQPAEPRKIQALIVTGQDAHPWRDSTPYLKQLLEQTGRFEVRVTEEFRGSTLETLSFYDVAILNYSDEKLKIASWSQATKDALLAFVGSGKGVVVYHHAAASFQDWPEYGKLVGCLWKTGQSHPRACPRLSCGRARLRTSHHPGNDGVRCEDG